MHTSPVITHATSPATPFPRGAPVTTTTDTDWVCTEKARPRLRCGIFLKFPFILVPVLVPFVAAAHLLSDLPVCEEVPVI